MRSLPGEELPSTIRRGSASTTCRMYRRQAGFSYRRYREIIQVSTGPTQSISRILRHKPSPIKTGSLAAPGAARFHLSQETPPPESSARSFMIFASRWSHHLMNSSSDFPVGSSRPQSSRRLQGKVRAITLHPIVTTTSTWRDVRKQLRPLLPFHVDPMRSFIRRTASGIDVVFEFGARRNNSQTRGSETFFPALPRSGCGRNCERR